MTKRKRFVRRVTAALRKLRRYLLRLKSRTLAGGIMGWDTVLDRAEAAIFRARVPGMFRRQLQEIESLRRRYDGYKMPTVTALGPLNVALSKIERALGLRLPKRRSLVRRRRR
jgi:hypothetical protein